MIVPNSDEYFMQKALQLAQQAFDQGEVPIGAVLVSGNKIIGQGFNQCEQLHDCTAHAEMLAITAGQNFLGAKVLSECTLYVTVEPCVMCAGALHWSQLGKLIFGASDNKRGFSTVSYGILHPKTMVQQGLLQTECNQLMKDFFRNLRY